MVSRRAALAMLIFWGLGAGSALGCRFTVHETGFVDYGIGRYHLFGCVGADTAPDINSSFISTADALLAESNVEFELVNTSVQREHTAAKLAASLGIKSLPAGVLVSPDGQALAVDLRAEGKSFSEAAGSAIEGLLSSAKREEIVRQAASTYGVVLVIEGSDREANRKARDAAAGAIKWVSSQLEMMAKEIKDGPVMVVVDSKSVSSERVLLWSLGIEEGAEGPYAAIIYGRARWMGPLFAGEEITEENLGSVLFVIGDSCECGLDRRWLMGTMLPVRWGRSVAEEVAKRLGFDPENPMVKMEVGSIMGRGMSSYDGGGLGYEELVIETDSSEVNDYNAGGDLISAGQVIEVNEPNKADDRGGSVGGPVRAMAFAVVGFSALAVIIGIAIALRPRRA